MRSRQKRAYGSSGMSPVIGVAILVAIVMALALAMLIFFEFDGSDAQQAPELGVDFNETGEYAEVDHHTPGVTWSEFQFNMDEPARFALVGGQVHQPEEDVFMSVNASDLVEAGDRIHFCRIGGEGPLDVTLRHEASEEIVDHGVFSVVSQCPEVPQNGDGN